MAKATAAAASATAATAAVPERPASGDGPGNRALSATATLVLTADEATRPKLGAPGCPAAASRDDSCGELTVEQAPPHSAGAVTADAAGDQAARHHQAAEHRPYSATRPTAPVCQRS